jgi:hypothetical protein
MWAQLILLGTSALSSYLVYLLVDAGVAGPLSSWWYKRQGRKLQSAARKGPAPATREVTIMLPPFVQKQQFLAVLAACPRDPATGESMAAGPQYEQWVNQCRGALLLRAVELVFVNDRIEPLFLDTYCKFTQQQASLKAWEDAQQKKAVVDKEASDIRDWGRACLFARGGGGGRAS